LQQPRVEIHTRAAYFLSQVTSDEWVQLNGMIDRLSADPSVDNVTTFYYLRLPLVWRVRFEAPFAIFFRLHAPGVLHIVMIKAIGPVPTLDQWGNWAK
jgi:hypothetical protein